MKLTKGIISRDEAIQISAEYVRFVEGNFDEFNAIIKAFEQLKRGQPVITYYDGQFIKAKVSSIRSDAIRAVDDRLVRVSNGEYSWRVDGDKYAFPA